MCALFGGVQSGFGRIESLLCGRNFTGRSGSRGFELGQRGQIVLSLIAVNPRLGNVRGRSLPFLRAAIMGGCVECRLGRLYATLRGRHAGQSLDVIHLQQQFAMVPEQSALS